MDIHEFFAVFPLVSKAFLNLLLYIYRLVGAAQPVELIMERGCRFESNEVQVVNVAELAEMNPHVVTVHTLYSLLDQTCLLYWTLT